MSKICKECGVLKPDYKYTGNGLVCHLCTNIKDNNIIDNKPTCKYRKSKLRSLYGLSLEDYDTMLKDQNHRCFICNETEYESGKKLAVDHNHITGQIRRLLCGRCNKALGLIREDKEILKNMLDYINLHENQSKKA